MIGDEEPTKAIAEACQLADPLVDFKQYDLDGDGKVEMVYVIYAGYGENFGADANTIWPHKYELSSAGYNVCLDDVCLDTYACSAELFGNSGTTPCGIGPLTHEFGHVLGLADHYNTATTEYELGATTIWTMAHTTRIRTSLPPTPPLSESRSGGWNQPSSMSLLMCSRWRILPIAVRLIFFRQPGMMSSIFGKPSADGMGCGQSRQAA